MSPAYRWVLYSPIGAHLASGEAPSRHDARAAAEAKLTDLGRKRGRVKIVPAGERADAYESRPVRASW